MATVDLPTPPLPLLTTMMCLMLGSTGDGGDALEDTRLFENVLLLLMNCLLLIVLLLLLLKE